MNEASRRTARRAHRIEHLQPWIAATASTVLHLALLWLALTSPPLVMNTPQAAASGGSQVIEVDFIGESPPQPVPAVRRPPVPDAVSTPRPRPRLQPPPIADAEDPVTQDTPSPSTTPAVAATPPSSPSPPTSRPAHRRGQPPGMRAEDILRANPGPSVGPARDQGRRHVTSSDGPSLDVGGYQVIYDLRSERRLREWKEQGMTEIALKLPGTRQRMVCPLEVALRRGSGECRLVEPDSPELADIGDAREVISTERVYRRGELVWRGPGPYR